MARLRSSRSFFSSDTICPIFIDPLSRFGAIPGNACSTVTSGLKVLIIARVVSVVVLALISGIIGVWKSTGQGPSVTFREEDFSGTIRKDAQTASIMQGA